MTTIFEFRAKKPEYDSVEYDPDETIEQTQGITVQHGRITSEFREELERAFEEATKEKS